ncbi:MAG: hypothetical protein QY311_01265 [Candidatus Paceibacterota bacterium]|nr:MAG: hypothetical protein QY311_01265 [Candidatus Paceibacterota bacterium]
MSIDRLIDLARRFFEDVQKRAPGSAARTVGMGINAFSEPFYDHLVGSTKLGERLRALGPEKTFALLGMLYFAYSSIPKTSPFAQLLDELFSNAPSEILARLMRHHDARSLLEALFARIRQEKGFEHVTQQDIADLMAALWRKQRNENSAAFKPLLP